MSKLSFLILVSLMSINSTFAATVYLQHQLPDSQVGYAVKALQTVLTAVEYDLTFTPDRYDYTVQTGINPDLAPEAFAIVPSENRLEIQGGDKRGLIYGALAAAGVQRLLEKTKDTGLAINVENHHGISSQPEWLAGLVKAVDSTRFALTVDTNNFRVDQDNPYEQDPSALPEYVDRYEGLRTPMPFANWVSAKCYAFDSTGYEV
jgi:hypothetical protein